MIVEQTVKAAMREQLEPPAPPGKPVLPADLGAIELEELEQELSEEVSELIDRLDVLRGHIDDMRLNIEDPILARRELRNILEEVQDVKAAVSAAYGDAEAPPPS